MADDDHQQAEQEEHESHKAHHGKHAHHSHMAGYVDEAILAQKRGIWCVKWSLAGLMFTAVVQVVVVLLTGSIALLADTIHNFGDAVTAIPLWVAFAISHWKPTKRFTYGYGRVEDLAGLTIVLVILASAVFAGYEAVDRLLHVREQQVEHVWVVAVAAVLGFAGNEAIARLRIKVGREIGSAALVADGAHARVDGLTSLAVLAGAIGVWLGFPLADPIIGLLITLAILHIVWESGASVFTRMLDGVDPKMIMQMEAATKRTPGVVDVMSARVRWIGHRLHGEVAIVVAADISVEDAHEIAREVHHRLLHCLRYLNDVTVHVDPASQAGPEFERAAHVPGDEMEYLE
jgi:cation diffusion facilitator family transporter